MWLSHVVRWHVDGLTREWDEGLMTVLPPVVLRSGDLSEAVGGQLMVGHRDVEVRSVAIDSRRVGSGDLFVAIRGQRFD